MTQRELPPIAGGAESPRERIERLVAEGKMPRAAVERAEQLWHERWQRGIQMPSGSRRRLQTSSKFARRIVRVVWR